MSVFYPIGPGCPPRSICEPASLQSTYSQIRPAVISQQRTHTCSENIQETTNENVPSAITFQEQRGYLQGRNITTQEPDQAIHTREYNLFLRRLTLQLEEDRQETFRYWPSTNVQINFQLFARNGFYFVGIGDMVECYCCSLILGNWQPTENPGNRHSRSSPECSHIRALRPTSTASSYEDTRPASRVRADRVPDQQTSVHSGELNLNESHSPLMRDLRRRFNTFDLFRPARPLRATVQQLAAAGFYAYGGGDDKVVCWYCGGGVHNFQVNDDPWEEHAKLYPRCRFLLREKGQRFVDSIQLRNPHSSLRSSSHTLGSNFPIVESGPTRIPSPIPQPIATQESRRRLLDEAMNQPHVIQAVEVHGIGQVRSVIERLIETENIYYQTYDALDDAVRHEQETRFIQSDRSCLPVDRRNNQLQRDTFWETEATDEMREHEEMAALVQRLQMERSCKVCLDRRSTVLFLPCRHLVTCEGCSPRLVTCPLCREFIETRIDSYLG